MRTKLVIASFWTLALLFGMLAAIVLLALYKTGQISAGAVFGITIFINVLMWLVGPKVTDWTQRFFYHAVFFDHQSFAQAYPQYSAFLEQECQKNKTPFPRIGFIDDDNPTAFSYGSGRWNSRLVFSRGILTYLEEDEVKAVLAHELGHIVHRDFIVMTVANSIIQLLYELYFILTSSGKSDRKGSGYLVIIGYLAYIFYFIGTYIVLFLNRLREYYADEFSAETTGRADALENALVKIAYGIMSKEDTAKEKRLLESTKTMGIMSLASAKSAALAVKVSNMEPDKVARVMLFDIVSPWAKLAELGATHPLTGKRLLRLEKIAAAAGKPARYNIDGARAAVQIDRSRIWRGFFMGAFIYFLPWVIILGALGTGIWLTTSGTQSTLVAPVSFTVIFLLLALRIVYKYPPLGQPAAASIYDLMTDIYANPLRGRPVALNGSVIGRGVPGYVFSEDMMMQDNTGLLYLDYQGRVPLFSNLMFALKKLKKLIGQNVSAQGWFYRSNIQYLRLKKLQTADKKFRSYPRLWSFIGAFILAVIISFLLALAADQKLHAISLSTNTNFVKNINSAQSSWQSKNYSAAISYSNAALGYAKTDSEKASAYYWRGVSENDLKQYDAAINDEQLAARLSPKSAGPYVTLGSIAYEKNDLTTAMNDAQTALQLDPSYAWAYNLRGIVYISQGMCQAGISDFDSALNLAPGNSVITQNKAYAQQHCVH